MVEDRATIAEYVYNGLNQRIKKVVQGVTRIFHYDLSGHLIAETNENGQMIAEYVYLGDNPLAMIKPGEAVYYYHNDHLGTPQILTDDSSNIVWKAVYTPFGEAEIAEIKVGSVENPFRFPGQFYDQETGLHYNWHRYYDPKTGRYLTPDPIGLDGGINRYVYVDNRPLSGIDAVGLWVGWIHKEITEQAAAKLNCNKRAAELADATAGVDRLEGAQYPENAYWHAMVNGKNPKEKWPEDIRKYHDLIEKGRKSCSTDGIKFALHALQDSYAPSHRFKPWLGGLYWLLHLTDAFMTNSAYEAIDATRGLLADIIKNCPCFCE